MPSPAAFSPQIAYFVVFARARPERSAPREPLCVTGTVASRSKGAAARPPHARRARQRPMGLMKYSSHYVTHSNSLPSETNGWLVDVPTVGGGVKRRPENRLLAE